MKLKKITPDIKKGKITKKKTRVFIFIITMIFLYGIWYMHPYYAQFSKYGYLGILLVNFISNSTIVFPLPGVASVFIGGAIWNPLWVGVFSAVGASFGELFGYFLGFGGRGFINTYKKENKLLQRIEVLFKKNAFLTIFTLALVPIPFFDFVGILSGALNYPVWKFFTATLFGRIIRDVIIAQTGRKFI